MGSRDKSPQALPHHTLFSLAFFFERKFCILLHSPGTDDYKGGLKAMANLREKFPNIALAEQPVFVELSSGNPKLTVEETR